MWYKSVHNLFSHLGHSHTLTQTDRQTDTHTQTNGGENIFPRFRRIIISFVDFNLNPIKKPNSTV